MCSREIYRDISLLLSLAIDNYHALSGNFTPAVWSAFWMSLPFIGIGLLAGLSLYRWLDPVAFRRVVLVMLVLMGIRLIL